MDELYNTYENTVAIYGDFEMPVPTYATYTIDKKVDYSIILALLLRSNSNREEDDFRYIDYSRLNKRAICEECKISIQTLDNRMKYLQEKNIITAKNTERGLVYYINYSKDGRFFVSIQHRILKALYDVTNKHVMKVYIMLVLQCNYLNNPKAMTNAYLCSQLGYSTKAENNLTKMGQWTDALAGLGFIEKVHNRVYTINEYGKRVILRTDTYYKINDMETWLEKRTKGVTKL